MSSSSWSRIIIACLVLASISSCKPDYYFEDSKSLDKATWSYDNILDFTIAIQDTQKVYNIYLNIDHSTEYAYQNIYLMIHTTFPNGKKISERLPIDFADKTGRWYGKCNQTECELNINLQRGAFFDFPGDYTIQIEQYMRIESLEGIQNITLMLEDTGKQRS